VREDNMTAEKKSERTSKARQKPDLGLGGKRDMARDRDRPAKCPACGKPVEAGWKACPACGALLDPDAARRV
jgi:hypothetical protein